MITLLDTADRHYEKLFCEMVMTDPGKIQRYAAQILEKKSLYANITVAVNPRMPWFFVGILNYRESSCSINHHMHNGDPLTARTVRVPKGRPLVAPAAGFPKGYSFMESCIDALKMPGQNFHLEHDWSLNRMLYRFEKWNGFGYVKLAKKHPEKNITNPYLWSCTNHYKGGKFERDGVFNAKLSDYQVGAAPLLRYLTDKTLGIV